MFQHRSIAGCMLAGALFASIVACESRSSSDEMAKETPVQKTAAGMASQEGVAPVSEEGLLVAPATSLGRSANDEGVGHGKEGHWDVAEKSFAKAIETDDGLAEARFNLGVVLDKQGKHEEAVKSFKKAAELAPTNKLITESAILKKHVKS